MVTKSINTHVEHCVEISLVRERDTKFKSLTNTPPMDDKPNSVSQRWLRFPFHAPNKKQQSGSTSKSETNNNHNNDLSTTENNGHFYANTPNEQKSKQTVTNNGHLYGNTPKQDPTLELSVPSSTQLKDRTYSISTVSTETEVDAQEQRAKYNDVLDKIQNMAVGSSLVSSLDLQENEYEEFALKTKSFSDGSLPIPSKPKEEKKKKARFTFSRKKLEKDLQLQQQLDKLNEEIRFDPDNLHLYLKRAKIHGLMGNKEEAKRDYDIIQNPSPSMINRTNRKEYKSSDEISLPESIQKNNNEDEHKIEVTPGTKLQGSKSLPAEAFRLRKY